MTPHPASAPDRRHLLVRHAESAANAGCTTADPAAIPLTAKGHEAASAFALAYAGPVPARIAVSPYERARRTAAPFIRRFPSVTVEEWPVHEFTYLSPARCGPSTPETRRPLVETYWRSASADEVDGPGAESFAAFIARVDRSLERLAGLPGPAVVFTHEMVMKAALWLVSEPPERTPQAFRPFLLSFAIPNLGTLAWPPNPTP